MTSWFHYEGPWLMWCEADGLHLNLNWAWKGGITILTKGQIFAVNDLACECIEVPEWGGTVTIRTLTGAERDEFERAVSAQSTGKRIDITGLRAKLVQLTAVNGDGIPLFESSDIDALQKKSSKVLDRLFGVAQRLNGLTPRDIQELSGNSSSAPSAGSGSV